MTACTRLTQPFGGRITADEQGWDWSAKDATQPVDGFETGPPARQLVVRDDQIGPVIVARKALKCRLVRGCGHNIASPAPQQPIHAIPNQLFVVDYDDQRTGNPVVLRDRKSVV